MWPQRAFQDSALSFQVWFLHLGASRGGFAELLLTELYLIWYFSGTLNTENVYEKKRKNGVVAQR